MTQVVAAILEKDGRILICQRQAGQAHAHKWEFPGGKVEHDEAPEQALARELREELGIETGFIEAIERYPYAYPGKAAIDLLFYRVRSWTGTPRNLIFQDMRWEEQAELHRYDFLEGDLPFLSRFVPA